MRKGNIPAPHLLPKLLATRKMLKATSPGLVPSSVASCPDRASPDGPSTGGSSGRVPLPPRNRCFPSASASRWEIGKPPPHNGQSDTPGPQGSCITAQNPRALTPDADLHLVPIFASLVCFPSKSLRNPPPA